MACACWMMESATVSFSGKNVSRGNDGGISITDNAVRWAPCSFASLAANWTVSLDDGVRHRQLLGEKRLEGQRRGNLDHRQRGQMGAVQLCQLGGKLDGLVDLGIRRRHQDLLDRNLLVPR